MAANAGDRINLKVKGQDGNIEVIFRIKRSTRLQKLMKAYCDRRSVDVNSIAFMFHGRRLRTEQTPHQLEMEDGDEIDAHVTQRVVGAGVIMEYVLLLCTGFKFCEVGDALCLACVVIYGICVCVSHPPFRMVYETDP
ncbi:hypothetical protein L6452_00251 [Arctium lappa]|uniref:Uncharacterized protein n=1 Tax=Arctium lappa TaxID=4217 RepID=A0ACB9FEN2_ARCLA|nr:hypothetical protein L6452_00251 [Arctium lappa]